jgi:hypothetical protein
MVVHRVCSFVSVVLEQIAKIEQEIQEHGQKDTRCDGKVERIARSGERQVAWQVACAGE